MDLTCPTPPPQSPTSSRSLKRGVSAEPNVENKRAKPPEEPLDEDMVGKCVVEADELQCIICQELFIKPVTLNCSHSFCGFCIEKWRRENNRCPMCRKDISSANPSMILENLVTKVRFFFLVIQNDAWVIDIKGLELISNLTFIPLPSGTVL